MNEIPTRRLGSTSLRLTEIAFGAASIGNLYQRNVRRRGVGSRRAGVGMRDPILRHRTSLRPRTLGVSARTSTGRISARASTSSRQRWAGYSSASPYPTPRRHRRLRGAGRSPASVGLLARRCASIARRVACSDWERTTSRSSTRTIPISFGKGQREKRSRRSRSLGLRESYAQSVSVRTPSMNWQNCFATV